MLAIPPRIEKHTPAWKKLGLKLKYVKEEPETVIANNGSRHTFENEKKRKEAPDSTETEEPNTKKSNKYGSPKPKCSSKNSTLVVRNLHASPSPPVSFVVNQSSPPSPNTPRSLNPKRRSVSFTPETKIHDGEGVREYIKRWSKSHPERAESWKAKEARYYDQVVPGSTEYSSSDSDAVVKRTSPSPKRSLKSKYQSAKDSDISQAGTKALHYLKTHHQSPATWKFNKSRQIALLRSLFSFTSIPPSYDPALLSYLSGLLKGAAATNRVRKMALECRHEDAEWMKGLQGDEAGGKREEYLDSVKRIQTSLGNGKDGLAGGEEGKGQEWYDRLMKRRRAELVLFAVGEEDDSPPNLRPSSPSSKTSDIKPTTSHMNVTIPTTKPKLNPPPWTSTPKPKRKRKARTVIVSDSSSSDSSGSSDEESESQSRNPDTTTTVPKRPVWDASSEDSSSSSSSDESEDESPREKKKLQSKISNQGLGKEDDGGVSSDDDDSSSSPICS